MARLRAGVLIVALLAGAGVGPGVGAGTALAEAPYARLFAADGLTGLGPGAALDYALDEPAPPDGGARPAEAVLRLRLSAGDGSGGDGSGGETADLALLRGGTESRIGGFPASVGNPLIMYFLESVLRDMAARAGGSPFYIRNRIKEALLRDATVTPVTLRHGGQTIAAEEVRLHPFANDAARARMGGFDTMELAFVVAPGLPGRFYRLSAVATPASAGSPAEGYGRRLTLLPEAGR